MLDLQIFSTRLKELRKEREIGQDALAREIHVSKGTISLWEHSLREPGIGQLYMLANYFNVPSDYLLGRIDYF